MANTRLKILFLTTQPPAEIKAEWPYYQNWTLPQAMRECGALVSIESWRDKTLDVKALGAYGVITFLWCNNYHLHPVEFPEFIKSKLLPAQQLYPAMRVVNDSSIILWNIDKALYLGELQEAGFLVPRTELVKELDSFSAVEILAEHVSVLARRVTSGPVVLKPSISGSSKQTHLIKDPSSPNAADMNFLAGVMASGIDGRLIVQEYEPAISNGEYSLVFTAGKHTHTMIKTPAESEFRCQAEFGGGIDELGMDKVPKQAKETAKDIMKFLASKGGALTYCRIDGVIRDSGEFVLMEVEAIEPHLWLETSNDPGIRDALYTALLSPGSGPSPSLIHTLWLRACASVSDLYRQWLRVIFSTLQILSIKKE